MDEHANAYRAFSVRLPTRAWFLGHNGSAAWYDYLAKGFQDVGVRSVQDAGLNEVSRSDLGFQVTTLDVKWQGRTVRVCYDWCDFDACHVQYARQWWGANLYFKVQCRPSFLDQGVLPIGQTVSRMEFFDHLPQLRQLAEGRAARDVTAIFRATAWDLRTEAVRIVRAGPWDSLTAVADYHRRPAVPPDVAGKLLAYPAHLGEQARSRICLALPGVGGDWTWRHTELLGMGAFMLTIEPEYALPGISAGAFATCRRDLADLAEKIGYWLEHDAERREVAHRGHNYYQRTLSPTGTAIRILEFARQEIVAEAESA